MKRKLLGMVTVGIMVLGIFTGCGSSGDVTAQQNVDSRFKPTGNKYLIDDLNWIEYVDTKTNNLYIAVSNNTGYSYARMTPLYDENGHKQYTYEQHESRQIEIEKELGCKFIRVTDKNSDEYNIGYVIKNMFNIRTIEE